LEGLVGDGQLVLVKCVDIGVRAQPWLAIVQIGQKFTVHFLVLEVGVGILCFHRILVENSLAVFYLPYSVVAVRNFVTKLLVPFGQVLFSDVTLENWLVHANFSDETWIVLELRLLHLREWLLGFYFPARILLFAVR